METNMKLFSKQASANKAVGLNGLVEHLHTELRASGSNSFVTAELAGAAVSMESVSDVVANQLQSSVESFSQTLKQILGANASTLGLESLSESQEYSAVAAGMMSGNVRAFLSAKAPAASVSENQRFIPAVGGVDRLKVALEAYDERENRNAAVYSVAYNMQSARQDEFGETLYPTVVVTPDQVGYQVSIHLVMVYDEVRRNISGAVDNFRRRNIIQAVRDPSVFKDDSTRVIPVYRQESADKFVSPSLVTPANVLNDGVAVTTAPLAFGKTFSLLGISQTDALLETGLMDSTDSLDPAMDLDAVYLLLDGANDEVIKFNTRNVPGANFVYTPQGDYRQMGLNFSTNSMLVTKNTKKADGSASTILGPVAAGNFAVRLGFMISGTTNLQLATTQLFAGDVQVISVTDEDGVVHTPDSAAVSAIAALFNGAKLIGFDLYARRTNMNRRQRGQLLDTTIYNQIYAVPLLSPITIPRPLGMGDATDASDLAALITATRIRTSNSAVDELLRAADVLRQSVSGLETVGDTPEILGVARFLVNPAFREVTMNVQDLVNSLSSNGRLDDVRATLLNMIRDMAYRMYRDSGYKAAADALNGGNSVPPTVIIATDPVIAGYLWQESDPRTLGNGFNVKVVSTPNIRMAGKIFVTFGQFDGATQGIPNPLHFGNMAWKPELALVLPLHRNGANSKELTVQPSYRHITNLPVLGLINVVGLEEVMTRKTALTIDGTVITHEAP